ncbi:MAG: DUF6612 family protein [Desulfurispora sp.]|uniref:DUF6612 family protein n=1 Tax=Desulfurispora sp. TaxID=3014275 RepID=UPI00404AC4CD
MRRKLIQMVLLGCWALWLGAAPMARAGAAEKVALAVNGETFAKASAYLTQDTTMLAAKDYARLAGAAVSQPAAGELVIEENGQTLRLKIGQTAAFSGEQRIELPRAPYVDGGQVYIPLRAVAEAFGYTVRWQGSPPEVSLERSELRQGLTAMELLARSGQATAGYNTYRMQGELSYLITPPAEEQKALDMPDQLLIKSRLEASYQQKPLAVYTRQVMQRPVGVPEQAMPGEMTVESYITGDYLYFKLPEAGWVKQKNPLPADFWAQQQDIQSNPIKAMQQMREFGLLPSYENDAVQNGREYYVLTASLDPARFKDGLEKTRLQLMDLLLSVEKEPETMPERADAVARAQKMLAGMDFDYTYTVYINKQTLLGEIIDLDLQVEMPLPREGTAVAPAGTSPELHMQMKGHFMLEQFGQPFTPPDISGAKEVN